MDDIKKMFSDSENSTDSNSVLSPDRWAVVEDEIATLRDVIAIHRDEGFYDLSLLCDSEELMRRLVSNLQLHAEESLYNRFMADSSSKDFASEEKRVGVAAARLNAKIMHRMGSLAMEEALLEQSVLFPGVPSDVLMCVGNDFLEEAETDIQLFF